MDTAHQERIQITCLVTLTALGVAAALYWLAPVMVPFVLAVFITIVLSHLVDLVGLHVRLPRGVAIGGRRDRLLGGGRSTGRPGGGVNRRVGPRRRRLPRAADRTPAGRARAARALRNRRRGAPAVDRNGRRLAHRGHQRARWRSVAECPRLHLRPVPAGRTEPDRAGGRGLARDRVQRAGLRGGQAVHVADDGGAGGNRALAAGSGPGVPVRAVCLPAELHSRTSARSSPRCSRCRWS